MRIHVDGSKYTFIRHHGYKVDILRGGQPWMQDIEASDAIITMMAYLDAARVVLQAARKTVESKHDGLASIRSLESALELHDRLCDDREMASPWADEIMGR
jgi:hypothetical protein